MHFPDDRILSRSSRPALPAFQEGMVLLVDKPLEWTSFDVVNKIRYALSRALGVKKIKVGHAGTLDPLATGVLLLCTGKFTRLIDNLQAIDKAYSGTFYMGATTPSYDAESEPDQFFETGHITREMVAAAVHDLTGDISQKPPVYSAIKIGGKSAYTLARRGKDPEMEARPVTIHEFRVWQDDEHRYRFFTRCSKGTYIRSLVYDLGRLLGSGAYLTSLRRDAIGTFMVEDCLTVEEVCAYINTHVILHSQPGDKLS